MGNPLQALLPRVGDVVLGRFELEEEMGRGGFGVVYRARQTSLDQHVAIKMLLPRVLSNADMTARFVREVTVAKGLRHPNTIRILDHGKTDKGLPFYVMEYITGKNLGELLEEDGPIGEERVVRIIIQVLKSLAEAHSRGVIHRDMKPTNIMLCEVFGESDFVKVLDFGIAKALSSDDILTTKAGTVLGSPPYMSPEQTQARVDLDHRSDLYGVGLIMAECLTGKPILSGDLMSVLSFHVAKEPVKFPSVVVQSKLWPYIFRATARDREQRFQNATEMRTALEQSNLASGVISSQTALPVAHFTQRSVPEPTPAPSNLTFQERTPVKLPVMRIQSASGEQERAHSRVTMPVEEYAEQVTAPIKPVSSKVEPLLTSSAAGAVQSEDLKATRPFSRPQEPDDTRPTAPMLKTPDPIPFDQTIPVTPPPPTPAPVSPTPYPIFSVPPPGPPSHPGLPPSSHPSFPGQRPAGPPSYPGSPPSSHPSFPGQRPSGPPSHPGLPPSSQASFPGQRPSGPPSHPGSPPSSQASFPGQPPSGPPSHPGLPPSSQASFPGQRPSGPPSSPGLPPSSQASFPGQIPVGPPSDPGLPPTSHPAFSTPQAAGSTPLPAHSGEDSGLISPRYSDDYVLPPTPSIARPALSLKKRRSSHGSGALLFLLFFSLAALGAVIWMIFQVGLSDTATDNTDESQVVGPHSSPEHEQTPVSGGLSHQSGEADGNDPSELTAGVSNEMSEGETGSDHVGLVGSFDDALARAEEGIWRSIPGTHPIEFHGTDRVRISHNGQLVGTTSDPLVVPNLDLEIELTFLRSGFHSERRRINLAETESLSVSLDRIGEEESEDDDDDDENEDDVDEQDNGDDEDEHLEYQPSQELLDLIEESQINQDIEIPILPIEESQDNQNIEIPILLDSD